MYNAQEAGIKSIVIDSPIRATDEAARKVIAEGLMKLGIISNKSSIRIYFPHGTSHYSGLDVHDRGTYQNSKLNTVVTLEPGIYIHEWSDCDEK